jgi:DNA polymerase III alpha subunit (gram-positive type)
MSKKIECKECGKRQGLFSTFYRCPACREVFCKNCLAKTGFIFKTKVCPDCGKELQEVS